MVYGLSRALTPRIGTVFGVWGPATTVAGAAGLGDVATDFGSSAKRITTSPILIFLPSASSMAPFTRVPSTRVPFKPKSRMCQRPSSK